MLLAYHLMFTVLSFIFLFSGFLFCFIWKKKYEWATLLGLLSFGMTIVIGWISRLGFHGIQFVDLDSTNTWSVYTYPEMWALNVLPYGFVLVSLAVMIVVVLMEIGVLFGETNKKGLRLPTDNRSYWKK